MNSSHPKHARPAAREATAIDAQRFAGGSVFPASGDYTGQLPGSMNDAILVRQVVTESMRKCGFSREVIADRMALLTGTTVTANMLNQFAAESRADVRFPAELDRAFCAATGDNRLLTCRAELAGLHIVNDEELALLELGREHLRQKRAAEKIEALETRLDGVKL